jgi:hypothetical protein
MRMMFGQEKESICVSIVPQSHKLVFEQAHEMVRTILERWLERVTAQFYPERDVN